MPAAPVDPVAPVAPVAPLMLAIGTEPQLVPLTHFHTFCVVVSKYKSPALPETTPDGLPVPVYHVAPFVPFVPLVPLAPVAPVGPINDVGLPQGVPLVFLGP